MPPFFYQQKKLFLKQKGFTIVELFVIITIFLILLVVISLNFSDVRKKNRDARGRADLRQMVNALELVYVDLKHYPTTLPPGFPCPTGLCGQPIPPGDTSLSPYLVPTPKGNGNREYFWYNDGGATPQNFCLYFQLELEPSKYFLCSNKGCEISNNTTCPGF